jgi:hypothetical protein
VTLTSLSDFIQVLSDETNMVPLAHVVAKAIAPQQDWVPTGLRFLQRALFLDSKESLRRLLQQAFAEQDPGRSSFQALWDILTAVHRRQPRIAGTAGSNSASYSAEDFQQVWAETRDFLSDEKRGLRKFFEVVKNRCGGRPCAELENAAREVQSP